MANTTLDFLGERTTWQRAQIVLDDIHGLWGGKRIVVRGDGSAFVTEVELTQEDQTFQLNLGIERAQRVFDVCVENDVLAITFSERAAVPDEAGTQLEITNSAGQSRSVTHWANSQINHRFEECRAAFAVIADNMAQFQPTLIAKPEQAPVPPAPATAAPAAPSPDRLLRAITDFFQNDNWSFEKSSDRPVLRLLFQGKNAKWNCFAQVRVVAGGVEQLLFYSVLPLNVPADKRPAVAEFITRANYGMAIGNFELDFSDGEVRYKTSIDASDAELTAGLIKPIVYTNCLMMDKYFPGVMSVVYAGISPADAVKQIEG